MEENKQTEEEVRQNATEKEDKKSDIVSATIIILVVIIIGALSICFYAFYSYHQESNEEKETISSDLEVIARKVVKVLDKYLDAELTLDEAYNEISVLFDQKNSVKGDSTNDLFVSIEISSVYRNMLEMKTPFGTNKPTDIDIKNSRDEIAKYLE